MRRILNIRALVVRAPLVTLLVWSLSSAACAGSSSSDRPDEAFRIVVSTSVHGDIVRSALGDAVPTVVEVEVVLPPGADPHEFAASAKQAETMERADLLVINGLGLEAGLSGVIEAVESSGTPVFTFADHVAPPAPELADDPHLWMDPTAVRQAVVALGEHLIELGVPVEATAPGIEAYTAGLDRLDATISGLIENIPEARRVMVTNHDSFGWFAHRYGLEVVGAVIPSLTTTADVSPSDLDRLADTIVDRSVAAIFTEDTESDRLAKALADQVGNDVAVVQLFAASLGDAGSGAETYVSLLTTDAERIVDALS